MSFDKKKIDAKIAALRKDRKLTQEQFAEKVGITVQSWHNREEKPILH